MEYLCAVWDVLKSNFRIDISFANCVELFVDCWLPHFSVVLECGRKSWIVICANFSLFHSVDVAISLNELFEKLIVGWVVSSEIVVENNSWIEVAGIFERAIALYEELTLELSFE